MDKIPSVSKLIILTCTGFICFVPIFFYKWDDFLDHHSIVLTTFVPDNNSRYLVATDKCKIPNLEPFDADALRFFKAEEYSPCAKVPALTYLTKAGNQATLVIDANAARNYTTNDISCCYSNITRKESQSKPDDTIDISTCTYFNESVPLVNDFIMVKCKDFRTKNKIYENTHVAVTISNKVRKKLDVANNFSNNPFSVMFVGIDSISRLNFIRSLPKTYQFVEENDWVALKGYNKIGDNTFPNLMGILTGFNESYAYKVCDPRQLNKLDQCPIIWKDYSALNYVTAYAEDESTINTFNYRKKGFSKPPTDYYFRPYIIGTERLKMTRKDEMNYCTGPETAGERILNIAKDFALAFKTDPSFSFFWMNTFSHNELNSASRMDTKIRQFLEEITNAGVLDNTIVVFLSDHGLRFGEFRYTNIGWLEERLPFIYFSIPERFKTQFPEEFRNLDEHRHKLTTPYDLHMTLQHILVLSGFNHTMAPSNACPECQSLFNKSKVNRSCEEAGIELHWCTCTGYSSTSPKNHTVQNASNYIISQIHTITQAKDSDAKCAKYSLNKVIFAGFSEIFTYKNDSYLLLVFETKPKAVFEATVAVNGSTFQLTGGISRLDKYNSHSKCVGDANLKKYCYCR